MLANFPLSTGLGTVNQLPPLAGSAFLNNVALLYSAQGLNSDREEVNLICNLNISSTSSLMSEWERKQRRREGQEQGLQQTDTGSLANLSLLSRFSNKSNNVHTAFFLGILSLGNVLVFFFCAYCWPKSETEETLSEFICFKKYQSNTKIWLTLTKSHPRQVQYFQLCLLQWFLWQVFISIQHKLMGLTEMQRSGTKGFFKGRGTEKRWLYGLPLYLFHFVPLSFGRKDWFFSSVLLI